MRYAPEHNEATRERILEAEAQLTRARAMWLPSIRGGVNYNKHEGQIQDVAGRIITTSRNSLYTGLGANAVGAGSPAVPGLLAQFHLTDAIHQPRIAGAEQPHHSSFRPDCDDPSHARR